MTEQQWHAIEWVIAIAIVVSSILWLPMLLVWVFVLGMAHFVFGGLASQHGLRVSEQKRARRRERVKRLL